MKKLIVLLIFIGLVSGVSSQELQCTWANQIGGPDWDIVTGMTVLSNENIIVSGAFYNTILIGSDSLVSNGSRDIFIASYRTDGSLKKVVSFGGTGYDYVKMVESSDESGLVMPIQFNQELNIGGQQFKGSSLNNILFAWYDTIVR